MNARNIVKAECYDPGQITLQNPSTVPETFSAQVDRNIWCMSIDYFLGLGELLVHRCRYNAKEGQHRHRRILLTVFCPALSIPKSLQLWIPYTWWHALIPRAFLPSTRLSLRISTSEGWMPQFLTIDSSTSRTEGGTQVVLGPSADPEARLPRSHITPINRWG